MYHRNDGSNAINALQNQFTAYLATAVRNARKEYIRSQSRRFQRELLIDEHEALFYIQSSDDMDFIAEADALSVALKSLSDRERYVLFERIIEEKGFEVIASELGMGYKGAAAIYYRTIAKLRKLLEG